MDSFNYCPECGTELLEDSKFCHSCGRELNKEKLSEATDRGSTDKANIADDLFIDDFSLENLDFNPYAVRENENRDLMEEQIENILGMSRKDILQSYAKQRKENPYLN